MGVTPEAQRRQRVDAILREVGLEGMGGRRPEQLSGGQPDLILADEPTANLDSATGAALLDMMRQLNQENGMTFVFSTHDQMIMERARRLVVLKDGKIDRDEVRP